VLRPRAICSKWAHSGGEGRLQGSEYSNALSSNQLEEGNFGSRHAPVTGAECGTGGYSPRLLSLRTVGVEYSAFVVRLFSLHNRIFDVIEKESLKTEFIQMKFVEAMRRVDT